MSRRLIGVPGPQARPRVAWPLTLSVLVLALASGLMIGLLAFGKGISEWQTAIYLTIIIVDQVAIYYFYKAFKTQQGTIETHKRIEDLYRQEILNYRNRKDERLRICARRFERKPERRTKRADSPFCSENGSCLAKPPPP